MEELLKKIKDCNTMPELDAMRLELVKAGKAFPESFQTMQAAFIKKKNQLNRIPLSKREW
ncbi:hypothetical protein [Paenibacillus pseudetheri]|uniref:Uncharacterized protein n=1 Tax=Paenibacillus pseudetheri TaxID=2897682 RepID=A0ABN8FET2_9BACL|nr:hypothetical protein [Paenibacillus pseudetheri]CAH1054075.1 hypothetical protein PAECIP111894_00220 [Paenibacillus pseudetheri]